MFKNVQLYRLPVSYALTAAKLEESLKSQLFQPCTSLERQSQGWMPPRKGGDLVHTVNRQMLLMFVTEKKVLPAKAIKKEVDERAERFAEQNGFRAGRKKMREIKDEVTDEFLPRAFTVRNSTYAWIDTVNGWLVIDSSSAAAAEDIIKSLLKLVEKFPVQRLSVNRSAGSAMTDWLASEEGPAGFTVDQEAELRSTGEGKATVRYVRHSLENADVKNHIASGKQCTRLAMTWSDKLSFVLTDGLMIKKVTPLDVLKQSAAEKGEDEDEQFDSEFVLLTGELVLLFADLIVALGGEAADQTDWVQETAKVGPGEAESMPSTTATEVQATDEEEDALYDQAVQIVLTNKRASISLVQRHLRIGYNRAARLLEMMEVKGVLGPMQANGSREILNKEGVAV